MAYCLLLFLQVRRKKPTTTVDTNARIEQAKKKARVEAEKSKEKAEKAKEKTKERVIAKANNFKTRLPIAPGGIGVLSFDNGDQYVKVI
ncbi:hypothetical protein FRX31_008428 [Thalictrum thalictroides]|uniref:Uncharacterized protein n=1 Tax=Thalictrum thalictroides TaxID=46969 RepID=A0A7J6WX31_THATH|nr:hypothetical protein FRX31_008428 [Thalictrum thalictroides]